MADPTSSPPIPSLQIRHDLGRGREVREMGPSTGPGAFGLGLAKVVNVDYVSHEITLQVFSGENDRFQRTAIPNTYPGAGARHFMGALPEPGDICVIGYLATTPKSPIILAWVPIGIKAGMEWLTVQDVLPTEADFSPKLRQEFEGIYGRYRYKMRSMTPGDVLLSSSKGSDLFLDQSVQLVNRRGNEFRLRDQDQAVVIRALQQFTALGGVRMYSGMVQRDGASLLARMSSDGIQWDAPLQFSDGSPIPGPLLGTTQDKGRLLPHPVFRRAQTTDAGPESGIAFGENLDPFTFLGRGLLLSPDGTVLTEDQGLEYAGKTLYRVALDPTASVTYNGAAATSRADAETLTEHRLEVHHTWDGHLPVTEQTDGVDADRIPEGSSLLDNKRPFIQHVLGSVVGNDPFSADGKAQYRVPLTFQVFGEGSDPEPHLLSALGLPLDEHAASLFRLEHPLTPTLQKPTTLSFLKDGRFRAFVGGPPSENSVEVGLAGGLRLAAAGPVRLGGSSLSLDFRGGDPVSNVGFEVRSETGAVVLSGGGPTTAGSRPGTGDALLLEAPTGSARLSSSRTTTITGTTSVTVKDTNDFTVLSKQVARMFSDKIVVQCNTLDKVVQGKETTLYSGPKGFKPSAAPFRETKFVGTPLTGHVGGTTDEYTMVFGDRKETFQKGDHTTQILVGNCTYQLGVGTWKVQAGTNRLEMGTSSGLSANIPVGTVDVFGAQTLTMTGVAGVTIKSTGVARVSGIQTLLGGTGKIGLILSSSDTDPFSGLPFSTFGLGSPGHRLTAPI